jgi:hypothetical protein
VVVSPNGKLVAACEKVRGAGQVGEETDATRTGPTSKADKQTV